MTIDIDELQTEIGSLLEAKAEASKTVLCASIKRDFSEVDVRSIHEQFEESRKAFLEKSPIDKVGAFVMVAVGMDAKGDVRGIFGSGGTVGSMIMLKEFIENSIRASLASEGACGCANCYRKVVELMLQAGETAQGTPH